LSRIEIQGLLVELEFVEHMNLFPSDLSPQRRALLAQKGRILYAQSCGAQAKSPCAESFALHQLRLGNVAVVHDLLQFLDDRIESLRAYDPEGLLPKTESLAARIRQQQQQTPTSTRESLRD
jgi:hypothetical protein